MQFQLEVNLDISDELPAIVIETRPLYENSSCDVVFPSGFCYQRQHAVHESLVVCVTLGQTHKLNTIVTLIPLTRNAPGEVTLCVIPYSLCYDPFVKSLRTLPAI